MLENERTSGYTSMAMDLYCGSSDAARDIIVPGRKEARKKGLVLGLMGNDYGSYPFSRIFAGSYSS